MTHETTLARLSPQQRKTVLIKACTFALNVWEWYGYSKDTIRYTESVVGQHHTIDMQWPHDALSVVVGQRSDKLDWVEPVTDILAEKLDLPEHVRHAYLAIYLLYAKYVIGKEMDDWDILTHAVASEKIPEKRDEHIERLLSRFVS